MKITHLVRPVLFSRHLHCLQNRVCVFAEVSYIPEKVVVKAGENVTVYCVFNDHNVNASTALWILNFDQELDYSLYHPINQWVSCHQPSLSACRLVRSMNF